MGIKAVKVTLLICLFMPSEQVGTCFYSCDAWDNVASVMQNWHGCMPQPMLEAVEGIPCRRGLLDGPLSLAKLLWQHAEPHERESPLMKEILRSAWQLLGETLGSSTACLREVYPSGCQALLEVSTHIRF